MSHDREKEVYQAVRTEMLKVGMGPWDVSKLASRQQLLLINVWLPAARPSGHVALVRTHVGICFCLNSVFVVAQHPWLFL